MAKRRRKRKGGSRVKGTPRKIGGRVYLCYTKSVKNARGGKRSVRAYCRKPKK